ncbi:hypothetical protein SKAU_G00375910 [Synaphobranchus kaupii]|uniref:Uncharacterized protein n=1 Tax=Synaphobranchus kaupii TaxID=118154 RepID=A0A9Q1ECN7_SYNKA|nr:hypothetical protein SKAU_G00375910 [Synaphobranchus kaupii]
MSYMTLLVACLRACVKRKCVPFGTAKLHGAQEKWPKKLLCCYTLTVCGNCVVLQYTRGRSQWSLCQSEAFSYSFDAEPPSVRQVMAPPTQSDTPTPAILSFNPFIYSSVDISCIRAHSISPV